MTSAASPIFLALGGNLAHPFHGPPECVLRRALTDLRNRGIQILACSRLWHSAAWPDPKDPPFVNAVAQVTTDFRPHDLLGLLKATEADFGRTAGPRNAPRVLDLDILAYGQLKLTEEGLCLPHPRLVDRGFVLAPWHDIAPDWRHPATGLTVAQMLAALGPIDPDVLRPLEGQGR